jgi:hypothetical protein
VLEEARLSDTGVTGDEEESTLAQRDGLQGVAELGAFRRAADEPSCHG